MKTIEPRASKQLVVTFYGPRIDDLFFNIEKVETYESNGEPFSCYYIVVTPKQNGSAMGQVRSAGCAINSDEEAITFLNRLSELKTVLNLASFQTIRWE